VRSPLSLPDALPICRPGHRRRGPGPDPRRRVGTAGAGRTPAGTGRLRRPRPVPVEGPAGDRRRDAGATRPQGPQTPQKAAGGAADPGTALGADARELRGLAPAVRRPARRPALPPAVLPPRTRPRLTAAAVDPGAPRRRGRAGRRDGPLLRRVL